MMNLNEDGDEVTGANAENVFPSPPEGTSNLAIPNKLYVGVSASPYSS